MQDSAPGHVVADTKKDLKERGVIVIFWPSFSLGLNPIEKIWHIIKNYFQDNYPKNISYDRFKIVVKDVWEKVGEYEFRALIENIPTRC
jgi:transposase